MQFLAYVLLVAFVYPLSLLPLPVLYVFSDVGYLLLRFVFGYRVRVVEENLRASFPEMSNKELRKLTNRFYRYLTELTIEGVKALSISKKQLTKRITIQEPERLAEFFDRQQSVIVASSHFGNWEWAGLALSMLSKFQLVGLYLPHNNPYVRKGMVSRRSRFGMVLVTPDEVRRFFARYQGRPTMTVFIADQSPGAPRKSHWVDFMNRETPFLVGPAKMASGSGQPLLFGKSVRLKRGHYRVELSFLQEDSRNKDPVGLTQLYAQRLEQEIRQKPEFWLWSHRRWKHARNGVKEPED